MTDIKTFDTQGKYHSYDDKPAFTEGASTFWYKHGLMHRENDLPACSLMDGEIYEWRFNGLRHRENNQPAMVRNGEAIFYGIFGEPHNENGPAYKVLPNVFFLYGLTLNKIEHAKLIERSKLKEFSLPVLALGFMYGLEDSILESMVGLPFAWAHKIALFYETNEQIVERKTACISLAWETKI